MLTRPAISSPMPPPQLPLALQLSDASPGETLMRFFIACCMRSSLSLQDVAVHFPFEACRRERLDSKSVNGADGLRGNFCGWMIGNAAGRSAVTLVHMLPSSGADILPTEDKNDVE